MLLKRITYSFIHGSREFSNLTNIKSFVGTRSSYWEITSNPLSGFMIDWSRSAGRVSILRYVPDANRWGRGFREFSIRSGRHLSRQLHIFLNEYRHFSHVTDCWTLLIDSFDQSSGITIRRTFGDGAGRWGRSRGTPGIRKNRNLAQHRLDIVVIWINEDNQKCQSTWISNTYTCEWLTFRMPWSSWIVVPPLAGAAE